jgi:hypothetical protein
MASEAPPKTPSKLTREELYNLVWQTPMQHVAAQYGITGNSLAKICDRLNVPYPYRGYWAKRAAKKLVKQLALPATNANRSHRCSNPSSAHLLHIIRAFKAKG